MAVLRSQTRREALSKLSSNHDLRSQSHKRALATSNAITKPARNKSKKRSGPKTLKQGKKKANSKSLTDMPPEIILSIGSHLRYPWVSVLRSTCRYLYNALEDTEPMHTNRDAYFVLPKLQLALGYDLRLCAACHRIWALSRLGFSRHQINYSKWDKYAGERDLHCTENDGRPHKLLEYDPNSEAEFEDEESEKESEDSGYED